VTELECPIEKDCQGYGPGDTYCHLHQIDLAPPERPEPAAGPPRPAAAPPRPAIGCWRCRTDLTTPDDDLCPVCQAHQPGPPLALVFSGGESIEVERGETVRLGRDTHPALRASNISRDHATIGLDGSGAWVADHRSLNGTWVNGTDLGDGGRSPVRDGDEVRLGNNPPARVMLRSAR
jgi:hypothetical protein